MVSNSMRRKGRGRSQWLFIVGLSVLGLLIIASASHAGTQLPGADSVTQMKVGSVGGSTPQR